MHEAPYTGIGQSISIFFKIAKLKTLQTMHLNFVWNKIQLTGLNQYISSCKVQSYSVLLLEEYLKVLER